MKAGTVVIYVDSNVCIICISNEFLVCDFFIYVFKIKLNNLLCATVNIGEAIAYQTRRRNFPPALYNYNPRWLNPNRVPPRAGQDIPTVFQLDSSSGNFKKIQRIKFNSL